MSSAPSLKTLEFKLSLNATQAAMVEDWLDVQRWVWNRGLALLKEFEAFSHYNKHDKAYAPCCPVPWEYRWVPNDGKDEWRDAVIVGSYGHKWRPIPMPLITESFPGQWSTKPAQCPLLQHIFEQDNPSSKGTLTAKIDQGDVIRTWPSVQFYRKPLLDRDSEYSLTPLFAHKLHEDKPWFRACPYKVTQGTIKLLATSWQEYRKGKRKAPRFKRRGDNRTLNDTQSGDAKVIGGYVTLSKRLGRLRVRSVEDRWPDDTLVKSWRIKKEPSGYYLLLVGELPSEAPKPSDKVAGLDAGVAHILNDDAGHHIDIPSPLKRRLKKIKRLSRKAARQQKGGKNQAKTYADLALTHEKVRRDRKGWHHKLSTFAVRKYAGIAVEDLKLANMTRKPKAKPKADGTGYEHNMAKAKAGLNRAMLDAGIGGLYAMMETKAKAFDREFVRVPPQYTSQTCNVCGEVNKASRLSQSEFVCVGCGHTEHADTNAARNIRDTAFPEHSGRYLTLAGGTSEQSDKPAAACETQGQQEGAQVPPQGDALAISPKGALIQNQRDPSAVNEAQSWKPSKPVPQKRRKNRAAHSVPETFTQLSLWDAAAETG